MLNRKLFAVISCQAGLLLLFSLLICGTVLAAPVDDGIGRVIALRGSAEIETADGSTRNLALNSVLTLGETVRTGQRCRLQILFNDNTIISLGPHSELVVEEYQWDGGSSPGRMKSVIREGVFRVLGGSITRSAPENFTTETPSATIGIRGSMYAGTVRNGALQVVFQGGRGIYVRNALRSVDISTPGFGTRVTSQNAPPEEPYRVPAAELEQLDPLLAAPEAAEVSDRESGENAPAVGDSDAAVTDADADREPANAEPVAAVPEREAATEAVTTPVGEETQLTEISLPDPAPQTTDTRLPITDVTTITDTTTQASVDASTAALQNQVADATSSSTATTQPPPPNTTPPDTTPPDTTPPDTTPPDTTPPDTTPPDTTPPDTVSGRYLAVQDDLDPSLALNDVVESGTVAGTTENGVLNLQATSAQGTTVIDPLPVNLFNFSLAYSGHTKLVGQTRTVDLLGQTSVFTSAGVASDNTGSFAITVLDDLFNSSSYAYRELGFAGVPTIDLPTAGIDRYSGPLLLTLANIDNPEFESVFNKFGMWVNWHNGKLFGIIEAPGLNPGDPPEVNGFFFGDVSGTGLANVHFIGMDVVGPDPVTGPGPGPGPFMPLTIDGTTGFSQFYGRQGQGLGLVAQGNTYDVLSQTAMEDWQFAAAGFREVGMTVSAATGATIWQGFAVGIGDDMTAPDDNRRIFMNLDPADFSLSIDRDAGSVIGTLNAVDRNNAAVALSGLEIGGSNGSAYISDSLIATVVGGTAPIVNGASSGNLKAQGNYLMSEDPSKALASYASWGNWEIAYDDPASAQPYHVHNPGTYWVAGERTPASDVQGLISSNFSATYTGHAAGVMIPASGSFTDLSNGSINLLVDFSAGASFPVSGTIDFTEVSLPVSSAPGGLDSAGFSGGISTATQSSLQGAFYGPGAASVGGSFDALMSTGERYTGVFGGDR